MQKIKIKKDEYIDGQVIAERLGLDYGDDINDDVGEQEAIDVVVEADE